MIPATQVISLGFWGAIFVAASVVVMAINAAAWRFAGRREIVSAAFYLGAVYFAAEIAQLMAFAYIDRPWAYILAIPSDLLLLYMARDVFKESREMWAGALLWVLFGGIVLQVWLWAAFLPHRNEKYNWSEYSIYLNYARISTVLGGVELALILWPGIRRAYVVFGRSIGLGDLWASRRRQRIKPVSTSKA